MSSPACAIAGLLIPSALLLFAFRTSRKALATNSAGNTEANTQRLVRSTQTSSWNKALGTETETEIDNQHSYFECQLIEQRLWNHGNLLSKWPHRRNGEMRTVHLGTDQVRHPQ